MCVHDMWMYVIYVCMICDRDDVNYVIMCNGCAEQNNLTATLAC